MISSLSSLNGLRSFEAAARHLSLKAASQELFVTPGAISQQIKNLEDELGVQLFRHASRKTELTEAGQRLLPSLQQAFQTISEALEQLADREGNELRISLAPAFAIKWLTPRLSRFQKLFPDIEIHLHASLKVVDFSSQDFDLAIRWGQGEYSGVQSVHLLTPSIIPICSPQLKAESKALETLEDLAHHTLLHQTNWELWPFWCEEFQLKGKIDLRRGPRFNSSEMLIQAAIEGQGIALMDTLTVEKDLSLGLLIKALDAEIPAGHGYYFVSPEKKWDSPKVKCFREWLITEFQKADHVFPEDTRDYKLKDLQLSN